MPASEARIKANQANAAKSRGPKTVEGKERSRRNALKHGLTGAGVVLPEADAAEVERRTAAFGEELLPVGEIEMALVRRAALNSVRMERGADQQAAAPAGRVRRVEAEFVAPEGINVEEAARLKAEAARIAMSDPSREATPARKYEAAAERSFYRTLKELRQREGEAKAPDVKAEIEATRKQMDQLASFFPAVPPAPSPAKPAVATPPTPPKPAPAPVKTVFPGWNPAFGGSIDVPITIGRVG